VLMLMLMLLLVFGLAGLLPAFYLMRGLLPIL
jgi:hypothetical protein